MMTKTKTNNLSVIKYCFALPLMMLTFFLTANSFNIKAQSKDEVYEKVDVMPEYPGGFDALRKEVASKLKYPEVARKVHQEAKVFVSFVVDKKGKITNIHIEDSDPNPGKKEEVVVVGYDGKEETIIVDNKEALKALEVEAVRVISELKDFKPGEKDGKKVNVKYTFPVKFILQ